MFKVGLVNATPNIKLQWLTNSTKVLVAQDLNRDWPYQERPRIHELLHTGRASS